MILTRLVKRLSSAFVCLSVWLKIIKLPFWLHVKAEHMAGVIQFMKLDQNSTRGSIGCFFLFFFFFFGNFIWELIFSLQDVLFRHICMFVCCMLDVVYMHNLNIFCTFFSIRNRFDSHLCIR